MMQIGDETLRDSVWQLTMSVVRITSSSWLNWQPEAAMVD